MTTDTETLSANITLTADAADGVFTHEQIDAGIDPEMVRVLRPEQARDGFGEAYSRIVGTGTAVSRIAVAEKLVYPFLTALPDLVEAHGAHNEFLKRLLSEVMTVIIGLRRHRTGTIRAYRGLEMPTAHQLCIVNAMVEVGPEDSGRLNQTARLGGVWVVLGDMGCVQPFSATDPVALLNWAVEFRQYASTVSFKVKMDNQQLKMLQAFFRVI